ncbi:TniB family NTP-binding protein, partial [Eudoraea sp.]|uniref:TniB family NTP-binding protein n=1 Tax=Eudoraea sp. TaxID=1979955 RepID=UPI003C7872B9
RPAALLIDEVQELSKVTSNEKSHDNLDVLKSLSDRIRVPVIAFGTSKAYEMLYVNAQTARRADVLHFGRYAGNDSDIEIFRGVVGALETALHIPLAKEVSGDVVYFYARTTGCVGILMDWMKRALALAIDKGARKVSKKHLDETALSGKHLASLVRSIKDAERIHADAKEFNVMSELGESPSIMRPPTRGQGSEGRKKPPACRRKPTQDKAGHLLDEVES